MTLGNKTVGIIGGTGMLGRTIAKALLDSGAVRPSDLWISNRSGSAGDFDCDQSVNFTANNNELADACDVVLLSVPPQLADRIGIAASDRLVISVMAGISLAKLSTIFDASRTVRAMSSPAAEHRLAYSPWVASPAVTREDRSTVTALFDACGQTDELHDEEHIDVFTALTGPVPGFVALFAESMAEYAMQEGISSAIADRAIRQLFLSGGQMMSAGRATPADHVRQMIDYAGTTAAGLTAMKAGPLFGLICEGLDASVRKTRQLEK